MRLFYNIFIYIAPIFIWIASLFSKKLKLFYQGRKGLIKRIEKEMAKHYANAGDGLKEIIWFHCSSVGEFEQARPIIEWYRENSQKKILLTFFSPSGYELRKSYQGADWVYYLPLDTVFNAKRFMKAVKPKVVIFTKYDLWSNYITQANKSGAQLYLISAIFRPYQSFFKWWGGFFRAMLRRFNAIFVQDMESVKNLSSIGIKNRVFISGDTRFDRVKKIADLSKDFPVVDLFLKDSFAIVAGSTWRPDDEIIAEVAKHFSKIRIVVAPHEIDEDRINEVAQIYDSYGVVRYSDIENSVEIEKLSEAPKDIFEGKKVMIIDCLGILSSLYKYATFSYIGGGFGVGIHNVLETAVYGSPIAFGPNYKKFREAVQLVERGGAISINNSSDLYQILDKCLKNSSICTDKSLICKQYVKENLGATDKIIDIIKEN